MNFAADNPTAVTSRSLHVNGERHTVAAETVADAVAVLGYGGQKVATALNGAFVPAALRATTTLADGDRLEIVAPRQGG